MVVLSRWTTLAASFYTSVGCCERATWCEWTGEHDITTMHRGKSSCLCHKLTQDIPICPLDSHNFFFSPRHTSQSARPMSKSIRESFLEARVSMGKALHNHGGINPLAKCTNAHRKGQCDFYVCPVYTQAIDHLFKLVVRISPRLTITIDC